MIRVVQGAAYGLILAVVAITVVTLSVDAATNTEATRFNRVAMGVAAVFFAVGGITFATAVLP